MKLYFKVSSFTQFAITIWFLVGFLFGSTELFKNTPVWLFIRIRLMPVDYTDDIFHEASFWGHSLTLLFLSGLCLVFHFYAATLLLKMSNSNRYHVNDSIASPADGGSTRMPLPPPTNIELAEIGSALGGPDRRRLQCHKCSTRQHSGVARNLGSP